MPGPGSKMLNWPGETNRWSIPGLRRPPLQKFWGSGLRWDQATGSAQTHICGTRSTSTKKFSSCFGGDEICLIRKKQRRSEKEKDRHEKEEFFGNLKLLFFENLAKTVFSNFWREMSWPIFSWGDKYVLEWTLLMWKTTASPQLTIGQLSSK